MKLFKEELTTRKHVTHFDSNFLLSRIAKTSTATHIGMVYLQPGEIIGFHKASVPQLLVVVEGSALVRNDTSETYVLTKGDSVYWEKGEGHETKTNDGLTALIIESEEMTIVDLLEESSPGPAV